MSAILVTDDDATTRQMVRGILKKAGHDVATAADGMAALRAIQSRKFDLLLLDIWMPKMTGLGLLGHLHGEKHIPKIVVMTSDQTSDTLIDALRGRVYQYLKKPLDATTLLTTVENAISTSPAVPAIEVISANAQEREAKGLRPGGLGLMLTQQLVDELVYNEKRNSVVLIKYL